VSKATHGSVLALTFLAFLPGCSKDDAGTAAQAPGTPPPAATAQPAPPHPAPSSSAAVDLSGITKAEGGKTVAEIFAGKDQLGGQKVTFRGKVVKTNANIMGKNWLHVRDGSGAQDSNDLTVTTTGELPKVGDTVIVTGQVSLNKDLGMGYQYDVLVEDAAVTVEAAGS